MIGNIPNKEYLNMVDVMEDLEQEKDKNIEECIDKDTLFFNQKKEEYSIIFKIFIIIIIGSIALSINYNN